MALSGKGQGICLGRFQVGSQVQTSSKQQDSKQVMRA